MITEELKKEAEECMHNALYWLKLPISKENVEQGGSYILKLLEPREKQIQEKDRKIAELEKENAELKADNEAKDIQIKELQEQKCYWKGSSFDWRHKFFKKDEVKRLVKKDKQLTKAKNLLLKVADVCGYPNYDIPVELYANIADFLKESEV